MNDPPPSGVASSGPAVPVGSAGPRSGLRSRAALVGAGSAAVLLSGLLPWLRLLRSDFTGYRLAELVVIAGDQYPVIPPSWVGLLWYLLPLGGALAWIVLFWRSEVAVRPVHLGLAAGLAAMSGAYIGIAAHYGQTRPGAYVAIGGSALMFAGAATGRPRTGR